MPKDKRTSPIPAPAIKPAGTVNVHYNMPKLLKNKLRSGLMVKLLTTNPTTTDIIIAGINERAVCKMS